MLIYWSFKCGLDRKNLTMEQRKVKIDHVYSNHIYYMDIIIFLFHKKVEYGQNI